MQMNANKIVTCKCLMQKINYKITIFRVEATPAIACFHAGPLYWLNLNLGMLVFVEENWRTGRKTFGAR